MGSSPSKPSMSFDKYIENEKNKHWPSEVCPPERIELIKAQNIITNLIALIYNFALVAGTTYIVITYDWSMWTYALTLCFFVTSTSKHDG